MNLIAYCFQATDPIQALFVEKIRDYDNKKQTAGSRAGQAVLLLIYSSIAHSTMFWIYSLRDLNLGHPMPHPTWILSHLSDKDRIFERSRTGNFWLSPDQNLLINFFIYQLLVGNVTF